jgi:penicillin amidase
MRRVWGILFLLLGCGLIYFFQNSWQLGGNPIPPLAKLLNPYSGIWQNAEDADDYTDFEFNSPFVSGDVKIVFDERMVPHIYANNLEDAMFAQGYVEAYHRLFQMDLSTRATDGKLSEILGEQLVEYDKKQLRLGLGYAADNAVDGWQKHSDDFLILTNYTQGVNHYINSLSQADYPIEYKLLNFEPSKWTLRHSALVLKAMSQVLAGYEEDIEFSNALKLLGDEDFKLVFPEYNTKDIPVIQGPYTPIQNEENTNSLVAQWNYSKNINRPRSPEGVGSNNWAISAERTLNGNPILANDPHLELSLPSVWYEIAITTPEFSARGVTLLGMPGIMIGFNEHIAWGETNVGHDVMDYHQMKWANEEKTKYFYNNEVKDIEYRIEHIKVKDGIDIIDSVRYTIWGPIVDDDKDLALQWLAHDAAPDKEFMTFVAGMTCDNYDDYLAATSGFYCPAQNFIYADNKGDIGLRINGNLPIKNKGQGRLITRGDTSADAWKGFIPRNENPQERNPAKGFVTSANQWSASPDFPYYFNGNFEPFRGRTANKMLNEIHKATIEDAKKMQQSTYSLEAHESLPIMLAALDSSTISNEIIASLKNWNYHYTAASHEASFYNQWFKNLNLLIWDEIYTLQDSIALPNPDTWVSIQLMESNSQSKFFDVVSTERVETMKDIIVQAYHQTITEIGENIEPWGKAKTTFIRHLTRIPALSSENLTIGGHKYSLNAMQENFGPSWRMIVELGETPKALAIYPGGQSGNPGSKYYMNLIPKWANGEYDELVISKNSKDIKNPIFSINIVHEKN